VPNQQKMIHAATRYAIITILTMVFIIDIPCLAIGWSTQISAGGDFFRLSRSSETMMMQMQGSVSGSITPVEVTPAGRIVTSATSTYTSMKMNEVGSTKAISAREGRIIKNDYDFLYSNAEADFYLNTTFYGNAVYKEANEQWPIIIHTLDQIRYKGTGLNDFENMENTYDRIGESSLYNKNFNKELSVDTSLIHFNASIAASDNFGIWAQLLPTTSTSYNLSLNSTGITNLYQKILSGEYDPKHQDYVPSVVNQERYEGNFNIRRNITRTSIDTDYQLKDRWPCLCEELGVNPWDVAVGPSSYMPG
jgi:hypothetical protein